MTLVAETQLEDNKVVAELGGQVFPDVEAGLRRLSVRYPLFIVSNCQTGYIEVFLRWSGLGACFRDFECWGNTGRSKAENLGDLVRRNQLTAPVYIGDSEGDENAAAACEIPFVHAAYGFGQCERPRLALASFSALTEAFRPPLQ